MEIENAKSEARALPARIDDMKLELSELPKEVEAARFAREQTVRLDEAVRRGEPERVEQAIEADARARGMEAADQPTPLLVAHLGAAPEEPTARQRWIEAAGRIAQHRALWPVADDVLVGPPPIDGPPERSVTYHAAAKAIADLDRTMGVDRRGVGRSGPGLSL